GQWRPTNADIVTGQVLYSNTKNPEEPPFFSGESSNAWAGTLAWSHQVTRYDWRFVYNDYGDDFRADSGFVPQVCFRETFGTGGLRFYPQKGLLNYFRTYAAYDKFYLTNGDNLGHDYFPGIFMQGTHNLTGQFEFHDNQVLVADKLITQDFFTYFFQIDPNRHLPRITFQGRLGDLIDFENARPGKGTNINVEATVRPTPHLTLIGDVIWEWLNLNEPEATGRLYTAQIERIKANYVFDQRSFLRIIGQYVSTKHNPDLYTFQVPIRDGNFLGSILYGYRLNWQTVFFVGFGNTGLVTEDNNLVGTNRTFFIKVSYAWQH